MASGIPKRATNKRRQERRAESWKRTQEKKAKRREVQDVQHAHNAKVGSTGKQRAKEKKNAGSSEDGN
jgi:hypothetical protein